MADYKGYDELAKGYSEEKVATGWITWQGTPTSEHESIDMSISTILGTRDNDQKTEKFGCYQPYVSR